MTDRTEEARPRGNTGAQESVGRFFTRLERLSMMKLAH